MNGVSINGPAISGVLDDLPYLFIGDSCVVLSRGLEQGGDIGYKGTMDWRESPEVVQSSSVFALSVNPSILQLRHVYHYHPTIRHDHPC